MSHKRWAEDALEESRTAQDDGEASITSNRSGTPWHERPAVLQGLLAAAILCLAAALLQPAPLLRDMQVTTAMMRIRISPRSGAHGNRTVSVSSADCPPLPLPCICDCPKLPPCVSDTRTPRAVAAETKPEPASNQGQSKQDGAQQDASSTSGAPKQDGIGSRKEGNIDNANAQSPAQEQSGGNDRKAAEAATPARQQPAAAQRSAHAPAQRSAPQFWTSQQMGVFHYKLPGRVPDDQTPVLLHLMLKVVNNDNGTKIWGLGFVEVIIGDHFDAQRIHLIQPQQLGGSWQPRVFLKDQKGAEHGFKTFSDKISKDKMDPFHLELELTKEQADAASVCQLRVGGWLAFFEVSLTAWRRHLQPDSLLALHRPQHRPDEGRHAVFVMSNLYDPGDGMAAQVIVQSIRYHAKLGVAYLFIYARPQMIESLLRDEGIKGVIASGQLRLLLWEAEIPMYYASTRFNNIYQYKDQTLVLSHSILAHHGEGAYLILSDLDEFLISTKPGSKLIPTMGDMLKHADQVSLGRLNAICADCYGTQEKPREAKRHEAELWAAQAPKPHPLQHYTLRKINSQQGPWDGERGKSIVDPDFATAWSVHTGYGTKGGAVAMGEKNTMAPMPALAFLHLRQLFSDRAGWHPWDNGTWVEQKDWQWALKDL